MGGHCARLQRVRGPGEVDENPPRKPVCENALGTAPLAAARSKGTCLSAKYRRIAAHRGPMKALVAVEHSVLVAGWNMLTNAEFQSDAGADYFTRRILAKTKARAIGHLEALGYRGSLQPLTDTA